MQDGSLNNLWLRVRAELLADKKKSAIMAVLLCVALFVGLKTVLGGKGPRQASAKTTASGAAPIVSATDTPPAGSDAERSRELVAYLETIDTTVSRDLFAVNMDAYPVVCKVDLDESLHKSKEKAADDSAVLARTRQEAEVRKLAGALNLQSTMAGAFPTAIINGQVVAQGHVIGGFRVQSIDAGSCVVARGAVKITLTMAQ